MKRLVLALGLGLCLVNAYAQTVEVGSNNESVVAIRGLQVGGKLYDVEFWADSFINLYGPHRDRFPFIGDDAGAAAADQAIRDILNSTPYERVGWAELSASSTYAVVSSPWGDTNATISGSASQFLSGNWVPYQSPLISSVFISFVVLTPAAPGDVNNDGDVDVSDLLELEQILTEP